MNRATAQWAAMGTTSAALSAGVLLGPDLLLMLGAVLLWWTGIFVLTVIIDSGNAWTERQDRKRRQRADALVVYHVEI
tara:strand:- start:392 stop:625 length:234 start_codon:yes stop_codon:yes gene_type:complete